MQILIVKSLQIEQHKTQIYYYDPQFARINVQSPQSATTLRRLLLIYQKNHSDFEKIIMYCEEEMFSFVELPWYTNNKNSN